MSSIASLLILAFWPFASGWMLLWGLAAAVPIVIHLWSKRKYNEVVWAAMDFLLAAVKKNARRIRIEQLLLLSLRVLILLLFAAALAEPLVSWLPALDGPLQVGRTHWVLVLDASYSMDARSSAGSAFARAQQAAEDLVAQATRGDGFSLVLMAEPPQVVIGDPAFDPADVIGEIQSLRVRHGGADLNSSLAELAQIVARTQDRQSRLNQVKVCFFTDLGANTWEAATTARSRTLIGQLAEQAHLALLDVGPRDLSGNLAVTSLQLSEPLVTVARDVRIEATVQNFRAAANQTRIQLLVDGRVEAEQRLDTPAGEAVSHTFHHRFETNQDHQVAVRLGDDALPADNLRYLSVPVRDSIRVLCVEGKPNAARAIAIALEPFDTPTPRVACEVATESALLERELARYDCVFLCNVGRFGRDEANVLHQYVTSGGGLVCFLGDQVQAENYNLELGGELSGKRVLPGKLQAPVSQAQYTFDPLEYRHPIVAPFRGQERSGLLTTPVWKYFQLMPAGESARTALAFSNGDPAILEETLGNGRSLLVATAGSSQSRDSSSGTPRPWTDLAAWPSFVPLVQEMLTLAIAGRESRRQVLVGEPLGNLVPLRLANQPLSLRLPDAATERLAVQVEGDVGRWGYDDTYWSGIYQLDLSPEQQELYAVNLNPTESNLERLENDLLPSQFAASYETDDTRRDLPTGQGRPIFRYVLAAVLGLCVLETLLAWFFGRSG